MIHLLLKCASTKDAKPPGPYRRRGDGSLYPAWVWARKNRRDSRQGKSWPWNHIPLCGRQGSAVRPRNPALAGRSLGLDHGAATSESPAGSSGGCPLALPSERRPFPPALAGDRIPSAGGCESGSRGHHSGVVSMATPLPEGDQAGGALRGGLARALPGVLPPLLAGRGAPAGRLLPAAKHRRYSV